MNTVQSALSEVGEGTGCEYFIKPRYNVSVAVLAALGLVRPIARSAPRCHEHDCPILSHCEDRKRFEDRAGIANKKFHLLAPGHDAIADESIIQRQALRLPLSAAVMEKLGRQGCSVFELHWMLAEQDVIKGKAGPNRNELELVLTVLAEVGAIRWRSGLGRIEVLEESS